jgi:hypothetical protein
MIYRILIDDLHPGFRGFLAMASRAPELTAPLGDAQAFAAVRQRWGGERVWRITGTNAYGGVMNELGLKAPRLANRRARFYFTEVGWIKVGRHLAAEARRGGHVVKIIRRKEPDRSQVVFRDLLQVAILPAMRPERECDTGRRRGRRRAILRSAAIA